jgi:hypothetical protein
VGYVTAITFSSILLLMHLQLSFTFSTDNLLSCDNFVIIIVCLIDKLISASKGMMYQAKDALYHQGGGKYQQHALGSYLYLFSTGVIF